MIEFEPWAKTPRLFRDITVTEKIDGTNSAIIIEELPLNESFDPGPNEPIEFVNTPDAVFAVAAQSRKRLIYPGKATDNFGFAGWVKDNAHALVTLLGAGRHFGEWWGKGIQSGYGLDEKRFSLFNTHRYSGIEWRTSLLSTVPVLYQGPNYQAEIYRAKRRLADEGSVAAPGFAKAEGVIVFHSASGQVYKALLENDHIAKGAVCK